MSLPLFILVFGGLLVLVSLLEPLAARVRLPSSVVLALVGIGLGAVSSMAVNWSGAPLAAGVARSILELPISSETLLYIFLPILLFQTAMTVDVRQAAQDAVPISVMAVLAVLVATIVIGVSLAPVSGMPLTATLLLGAIVATTDPAAVVAIFREVGAPARLGRLVEGESLLNDAAAITLTILFMGILLQGNAVDVGDTALAFVRVLAGGAAVGYVLGAVIARLLNVAHAKPLAQVALSLALPYLAFAVAEHGFHFSGVIAVVAAGITLNVLGPARASQEGWRQMGHVWEQLEFVAVSLVFILAAILVPKLLADVGWHDLLLLGVLIAAALAARAAILFGLLPLLSIARLSPVVPNRFRIVMLWGGLRGAMTLALALSVTEAPGVAPEVKRFVAVLATGFVLFTLMVQGTTLRFVMRLVGLDQLNAFNKALRQQVLARADENLQQAVGRIAQTYGRPELVEEFRSLGSHEHEEHEDPEAWQAAAEARLALGLLTLAQRERELVLDHFERRTISVRVRDTMLGRVARLIDRARTGGRYGYMREAERLLAFGWPYRLALVLQRRFGINQVLARLLSSRFESLILMRSVIDGLEETNRTRIASVLGYGVAHEIGDIIEERRRSVTRALDALRLQYPDYASELSRSFVRDTALRFQQQEYDELFSDGLIGPELYQDLRKRLEEERDAHACRLELDLGLDARTLARKLPMFDGLSEADFDDLARLLRPIFALPGQTLIRKGERGDSAYFISSGAVEVQVPGREIRLGRGDIFGEMALLTDGVRTATVRSIAYCSLLRLDVRDFRSFLDRHPDLRQKVEAIAAARRAENAAPAAAVALEPEVLVDGT